MINKTNSHVNFGAKFIKKVNIKKFDKLTNEFKPIEASFVKFDPKNKEDLTAISSAVDSWEGQFFAKSIADHASKMQSSELSQRHNQIYLLSSQKDNFENLEPSKILGMAKTEHWKHTPDEIRYFETKPDIKHSQKDRTIKDVGKAMIESLKELYPKRIELTSSTSAADFYEKQGFKLIDEAWLRYRWDG